MKSFVGIVKFLDRIFWPSIGIYIVYLVSITYMHFQRLKFVVDKEYFITLYYKNVGLAVLVMCLGLIFKLWGKNTLASLIISIPAAIATFLFLITILAWVFLAVVMIVFSKN
jgi:hypothetical protein